jgi:hypothetical protein
MTCRGRTCILGPCPPGTQASTVLKANLISPEADKLADPNRRKPIAVNTELRTELLHPDGTGTRASRWHTGICLQKSCLCLTY